MLVSFVGQCAVNIDKKLLTLHLNKVVYKHYNQVEENISAPRKWIICLTKARYYLLKVEFAFFVVHSSENNFRKIMNCEAVNRMFRLYIFSGHYFHIYFYDRANKYNKQ